MPVPSELRSSLPPSIDPEDVRAAVRAPGSPGSLGGETWLIDVAGRLAVFVRASIFDALEPVALGSGPQPVTLRDGPELEIRRADADAFVVRPSLFEVDSIKQLLADVDGPAELARVSAEPEPAAARLDLEPASLIAASPAVAEARPHPVTLTDYDALDPDLEAEANESLAAGEFERTLAAARQLAQQSGPRERDEWLDLVEIVTLMRSDEWVAAYLWTRGVRAIPTSINDALFARLRRELERVDEPALAWSALNRLILDDSGVEQRRRIEAELGRDGPALIREIATRARELFGPLAEAGDRLAQRGLAQALLDLDELDDALTWVRRAIAAERFDFAARMLETQILALIAIERRDDRELIAALQKAADDFHDRPEPLVDLADHVEYEDSAWAIELLRKAQEREFDQFTLLTLVELLETSGRHGEAIEELEYALADPAPVELVADQLREKLAAARARFALSPERPSTPVRVSGEQAPAPVKANLLAVAVLLAVIAMAVALALGF